MSPTLEILYDEEIAKRRAALVRRAGMTVEEMRTLAESYELDQAHEAILRRIEELDFLSGE